MFAKAFWDGVFVYRERDDGGRKCEGLGGLAFAKVEQALQT